MNEREDLMNEAVTLLAYISVIFQQEKESRKHFDDKVVTRVNSVVWKLVEKRPWLR